MKIHHPQRGFTLVETLVSIAAFSIAMLAITAIFVQMMVIQRRSTGAQKMQENAQYVLETMAREIRASEINPGQDADCVASAGTTLALTHASLGAIAYSLQNGVVFRQVGGAAPEAISGDDVLFERLDFCVKGSDADGIQARVAIIAEVTGITSAEQEQSIMVQTTVTQRQIRE